MACTDSGNWTVAPPTCEAVQCPAPPNLHNGAVSYGDDPATRFSYEKNCSFRCKIGYRMKGPKSVMCTSAAQWSDMPRCEEITCPAPEDPKNGHMNCTPSLLPSQSPFPRNSVCTFSCQEGYVPQGVVSMACTDSGNWTIAPPTCKAVQCSAPPPLPNGAVSCGDDPATRFSYENNCTFRCDIGYQMKGPESVTCTSAAQWSDMPRCE
ncbi:E-selectin-like [Hippocampus comes]|uniref:E-selectin-like n=1 Tax=Hippocampus comes TaxID=109280 RepID=UPI00094E09CA|nr:PREDICTED: E-selectin-like [Hippocampus comes]